MEVDNSEKEIEFGLFTLSLSGNPLIGNKIWLELQINQNTKVFPKVSPFVVDVDNSTKSKTYWSDNLKILNNNCFMTAAYNVGRYSSHRTHIPLETRINIFC